MDVAQLFVVSWFLLIFIIFSNVSIVLSTSQFISLMCINICLIFLYFQISYHIFSKGLFCLVVKRSPTSFCLPGVSRRDEKFVQISRVWKRVWRICRYPLKGAVISLYIYIYIYICIHEQIYIYIYISILWRILIDPGIQQKDQLRGSMGRCMIH